MVQSFNANVQHVTMFQSRKKFTIQISALNIHRKVSLSVPLSLFILENFHFNVPKNNVPFL